MAVTGVSADSVPGRRAPPVAVWLLGCCAMIFVMVVLGGVTRLTHSGLSIVEWKPLVGWIPPLSEADWEELFRKYQAFPEYQQLNHAMTLAQFKPIYWIEYVHRLWGRAIGLVFLIPFLAFAATGRIERRLWPHFAVILMLGAAQGALGWYMVQSGLVERPGVSQYRLTAHLAAAFLIYGYVFWLALDLLYADRRQAARGAPLARVCAALAALVFLTVLAGGFVAGTAAGFVYNTFPLMDGRLVPDGLFDFSPWYANFFENAATIQFTHRVLAILTLASVILFWAAVRRRGIAGSARRAADVLLGLALLQVGLGVATLMLVVPLPLATAHQAGALLLFTAALWTLHRLRAGTGQ